MGTSELIRCSAVLFQDSREVRGCIRKTKGKEGISLLETIDPFQLLLQVKVFSRIFHILILNTAGFLALGCGAVVSS